jgi:hypothetical protein
MVEESGCDTLVSFPGTYSFNFWARRDSPTSLNVTAWPLLTPNEQRRVIADVERAGRVCVLTNAHVERILTRVDVSRDPLMEWRGTYRGETIGSFDAYELRVTSPAGSAQSSAR